MTELLMQRLALEPLVERDKAEFSTLLSNAEVMRYSLTGPLEQPAIDALIKNHKNLHQEDSSLGYFSCFDQLSQVFMGYVALLPGTGRWQGEFELCYRFLPQYWGLGYASEAVALILKRQSKQMLSTIFCLIHKKNTASLKVALNNSLREIQPVLISNQKFCLLRYSEVVL